MEIDNAIFQDISRIGERFTSKVLEMGGFLI